MATRTVEIFSAGCSVCTDAMEIIHRGSYGSPRPLPASSPAV
jgi:hypothetical protein